MEWTTRSIPSESGRWLTGVAKVLSQTDTAPPRRAISATASRSVIPRRGLLGVST